VIKQWSLSRYKDYKKCPRYAKYKHVDRLKEPPNDAMARGLQVHKLAELTAMKKQKIPPELRRFEAEFKMVQKTTPIVEEKWAFTEKWTPTEFFAPDVKVRVVCDLVYPESDNELVIVDHKTGKKYEDHIEDISLYGLGGFIQFPNAQSIRAEFWYLDLPEDNKTSVTFVRSQMAEIKKEWAKKTKPMLSDKTFAPRANSFCKWCIFSKGKGGPCQF
jgi:hypothetical protein